MSEQTRTKQETKAIAKAAEDLISYLIEVPDTCPICSCPGGKHYAGTVCGALYMAIVPDEMKPDGTVPR